MTVDMKHTIFFIIRKKKYICPQNLSSFSTISLPLLLSWYTWCWMENLPPEVREFWIFGTSHEIIIWMVNDSSSNIIITRKSTGIQKSG